MRWYEPARVKLWRGSWTLFFRDTSTSKGRERRLSCAMLNKWTGTDHAKLATAIQQLERDKSKLLSLPSCALWRYLETLVIRDNIEPAEYMVYAPKPLAPKGAGE